MDRVELLLSVQRSLCGEVTPRLRAVSCEADEHLQIVRLRFIFDTTETDVDHECASCAAAEVIADLYDGWTLEEEYVAVPGADSMTHLSGMAFMRFEEQSANLTKSIK